MIPPAIPAIIVALVYLAVTIAAGVDVLRDRGVLVVIPSLVLIVLTYIGVENNWFGLANAEFRTAFIRYPIVLLGIGLFAYFTRGFWGGRK